MSRPAAAAMGMGVNIVVVVVVVVVVIESGWKKIVRIASERYLLRGEWC